MGFKIIPDETSIPFMRYRKGAFALSFIAVIASIFAFLNLGLNLGIDFTGGAVIEVGPAEGQAFSESDLTNVRAAVADLGLGSITVNVIGSANPDKPDGIAVVVELQEEGHVFSDKCLAASGLTNEDTEKAQQIATSCVNQTLTEVLGQGLDQRRIDVVGPTVSGELIQAGIKAIIIAVIAMLIYIWLRFEWQFSIGAIAALVHDVILTIGMFAVTQLEFNLSIIAALLTIVGYSMNDTVVVYDRVRENLRKFKKKELDELLDFSINQTLARTIMTSVTTLLALGALFIFGGDVLRGFTAAMIWGVLVGTYSSIAIAAPFLRITGVKRDWSKNSN